MKTGTVDKKNLLGVAILPTAPEPNVRSIIGVRLSGCAAPVDSVCFKNALWDGIGRHVEAQRLVFKRNTLGTRQALIQRAAELEHDNDDKIAGSRSSARFGWKRWSARRCRSWSGDWVRASPRP